MGDIFHAIFGGGSSHSQQESSSSNVNNDLITQNYAPVASTTQKSSDAITALLNGDTSGLDNYKSAVGYDAEAENGSRGITANGAASGWLRSGALGKRLQSYGQGLNGQYANDYIAKLLSLAGVGTQAGGLLVGSGSKSSSSGSAGSNTETGAFGKALGAALAASDRRLKTDIVKIGQLENGLSLYSWTYVWGEPVSRGVMADEVATILPEALGPVIHGYKTVDYSKIGGF